MGNFWIRSYALMALPVAEVRRRARRRGRGIVDQELGEDSPVQVHILAEEGRAGDVLVDRSTGAGLLVVGSHGRSQLPGMVLGSTALHCVVHAHCPVLVVHPAGRDDHDEGAPPMVAAGQ
jgi:nucleotide-binding universal stress UspA family protein